MSEFGSIFISYRRSDSIAEAGRVYDKLVEAFGSEHIFKDVDNIPYGADFVDYLDQAVAQCDVLIPLIGRSWLTVADSHGNRRIDDPNDFVRIEIDAALKRDILVLPVLLGGAVMPGPGDLPEVLQPLARRNAAQVRYDPDFHSDMQRLIAKLQHYFSERGVTTVSKRNAVLPVGQPSQARSETPFTVKGILLPIIFNTLSGALALLDGLNGGGVPNVVVGALLLVIAAALTTRQFWVWWGAIAIQIPTILLFTTEFIDILHLEDDLLYALLVLASIIVLALSTIVVLLLPATRRQFR
ncbi:MAG: toll/interleukin-1 receptor domain-containing protein [Cyanobacteria bacterium P01_H01_bin.21]